MPATTTTNNNSTMNTTTTPGNKRSVEDRTGVVDQLVKGMNNTGIHREAASSSSSSRGTIDFLKRNSLYGYGSSGGGPVVLDNVHSIFAAGLERRRREAYCLGYGVDKTTSATTSSSAEPPNKRRRFQRRNSKTPAMLFSAMKMPQELFDTDDDDNNNNSSSKTPKEVYANARAALQRAALQKAAPEEDDADWDGGLEIAEQLVKQLQKKRRMSDASSVTAH